MRSKFIIQTIFLSVILISCGQEGRVKQHKQEKQYAVSTSVEHPAWSKNAVIYEVNIRQYSEEGTFKVFAEHLPRLQKLGVDILWLMPVYPIGELNRKATQTILVDEIKDPDERKQYLGSYYSTKDYLSVNPEFGTMEDFRSLVDEIHELGMYVILDIAVNHTAWDHAWVKTHPEYYTKIDTGNTPWNSEWMKQHPDFFERLKNLGMTYPVDPDETDWWDTADLNYDNHGLRDEMKNIFKYWVSETGVDGYRCDVAGLVPCDFWNEIRASLDSIKPVFMLAEDEENTCLLKMAFDMNYAWEFHHLLNDVAKGDKTVRDLKDYIIKQDSTYDPEIYRMNFITNHDENSWNGTEFERMGDAVEVMALLTFTVPGMPLIYTGQETGLMKRLEFFKKDMVEWKESKWEKIYQSVIHLKKSNQVLWNGSAGGAMQIMDIEGEENIFAFARSNDKEELLVITNLSDTIANFQLPDDYTGKNYYDALTKQKFNPEQSLTLDSFGYLVLKKR